MNITFYDNIKKKCFRQIGREKISHQCSAYMISVPFRCYQFLSGFLTFEYSETQQKLSRFESMYLQNCFKYKQEILTNYTKTFNLFFNLLTL